MTENTDKMITATIKKTGPVFDESKRKRTIAEEMNRAMQLSVSLLQGEVARRTPTGATGILRGSIAGTVSGIHPAIEGRVGTNIIYALPVEKGRGAGKKIPPISAIQYWARRKLGISAEESKRIGFLIARSIARKGIKGVGMFSNALKENKAKVERIFENIGVQITVRLNK